MKVTYSRENKILTLQINEEIDHHIAEKIKNKADLEIQRHMPKQVVLDFKDVTIS